MIGNNGPLFKKGRANLIAWRDGCARKLLGVSDNESLNVHDYNTIESVELGVDEYVADQISKYIESMPPGKSFTEHIDVAGVFWDLSVAAISSKANKTIDALCIDKFEINYDQIHGWQWFAEKSIKSNNAYAFSVIEKIISQQSGVQTYGRLNYGDMIWKYAAYDIKDLFKRNNNAGTIEIERGVGESDRSWAQENLSRLGNLFCLSLNVINCKHLAVAEKRLSTFLEKNAEDLKAMKGAITREMTTDEIGEELFQEAMWSYNDGKFLGRINKNESLAYQSVLIFSVWCSIMKALTGADNKKMLIKLLSERDGANEYYNDMADIFLSVVEDSILKDGQLVKAGMYASKRSI
jgi:hypothetical protein